MDNCDLFTAVHRWSVTGTPIEKSIDNLYGLLYFLDCEPYCDLNAWKQLTIPFQKGTIFPISSESRNQDNLFVGGDAKPLINVLSKMMWRTCKSTVFDSMGIPPQTEILHMVTMSDLQAFFYASQHTEREHAFNKAVQKLGTTLSMSKMNPSTLKKVWWAHPS